MIERSHPELTIRKQCALLDLPLSTLYYQPQPVCAEDLELMRKLDRFYLETPFYGVRRMTWRLQQEGHLVNEKRVRRLLRIMGLETLYPKPRLSLAGSGATIAPYLLRGLTITRADEVWASDFTYIPLLRGFAFLCAVMDWASRYVISWELSTTQDALLCIDPLERALSTGRRPGIFNTDQGSQYTCHEFTRRLTEHGIRISHDGKGRCLDNVFVERLWRSVKYEEVFLKGYADAREARREIGNYLTFYNHRRPHSALDKQPPAAVYFKAQTPDKEDQPPAEKAAASSKSSGALLTQKTN
jgi:putative transposase